MKRLSTLLLPLAFFAATSYTATTQAASIVNQPPQIGDFGAFTQSDLGAPPLVAGDVFSLLGPDDLFEATWYGLYVTDSLQPAPPITDRFTVGFYALNGGIVDASPTASLAAPDLTVTRSLNPIDTAFGFSIYSYSATLDLASLAVPVTLPANDYLFSVTNDSTGAGDVDWFWRSHSTGDPSAQGRALLNGEWTEIGAFGGIELAYTLKTAPTPPSLSIMLCALGLLGATRCRYKDKGTTS